MKNGKLPTREQKIIMESQGLDPDCYLVVKNLPDTLEIVSRAELERIRAGKPRTRIINKSK